LADILRQHEEVVLVVFPKTLRLSDFSILAPFRAQIEERQMVALTQLPYEYMRLGISIAPLEVGNVFCECKSEIKYIEAALVNVCSIVSPTGPYSRAIRHGYNGLLAKSVEEWHHSFSTLIESVDKRKTIADNARNSVHRDFGFDRRIQLFNTMINCLFG
jgi:hypothetical protein